MNLKTVAIPRPQLTTLRRGISHLRFPVSGLCLVFFTSFASAAGFTDANWTSMGGIPGANGPVYVAVGDGCGNLYIGGSFTTFGDFLAKQIAKWNRSIWA